MEERETELREILEQRARTLAEQIEALDKLDDTVALLEFFIMGGRYAVLLKKVHAVIKILEITSIPLVPRHIPGIIRRQGESIALVNLDYFFHSDKTGIFDADFAMIVTGAGKRLALQVVDVIGVVLVREKDLRSPQDNFDPSQAPYISAVTLDGLIVLDLDALVQARGFTAEKTAG
jgi:chemotaxis signal transduction protein